MTLPNTVTARVTAEEYAQIAGAVGDKTVSEWIRAVAIAAVSAPTPDQHDILVAETLAMRILLNVVKLSVSGKTITPDALATLISESDAKKLKQASLLIAEQTEA